MRRFIKQHIFIIIIGIFSLISTAFLIGDYHLSNNQRAEITKISTQSLEKEIKHEKEEFESSDFNIFNNIYGLINDLFSSGF